MKNLGNSIIILFSFISTAIYANVVASVSPKVIYRGEEATYILKIDGSKIEKPIINTICGSDITSTSSKTSIEMINMDYKKSYTLSYNFVPKKSCVIDAVEVEVDGKTEKSNAVKVNVKKPTQNKNADFLLSLKASKQDMFVGEPFTLELLLKQKRDAEVLDSKFVAPAFKGFWVKGKPKTKRYEDDDYLYTKAIYKLAPQRDGNLTIDSAQIKIATRLNIQDSWGMFVPQVKWNTYFSNDVKIHAKALPSGVKLVGDFKISVNVNKHTVNQNEAVNVTVKVEGKGNLEDVGSFKPYLNNVNVFDQKIEIHGNKLVQKLAFVSDKDFVIPSFYLIFYDLKHKRVQRIKTKPIKIKVRGTANIKPLEIKKAVPLISKKEVLKDEKSDTSISIVSVIIIFLIGTAFGFFISTLKPLKYFKKEKKSFSIKNEKLLLVKLLPYKDKDLEVQKIVDILEKNIYFSSKEKVDKKILRDIIKKYNIS